MLTGLLESGATSPQSNSPGLPVGAEIAFTGGRDIPYFPAPCCLPSSSAPFSASLLSQIYWPPPRIPASCYSDSTATTQTNASLQI
ncbi:hypothetical protein KCP73_11065 [Salmonella enterica subsp. enterica]|nr:hypothetical protein KCP73_11065 [Salmonella enterica subsp. enterica]